MTPPQMLALIDRYLGGDRVSEQERSDFHQIMLAASFAAQAFMDHVGCDGGATSAMMRAFLTALVDPLHPDLDHLRQKPEAGQTARYERKSAST